MLLSLVFRSSESVWGEVQTVEAEVASADNSTDHLQFTVRYIE